jgi:hypothetical protein
MVTGLILGHFSSPAAGHTDTCIGKVLLGHVQSALRYSESCHWPGRAGSLQSTRTLRFGSYMRCSVFGGPRRIIM